MALPDFDPKSIYSDPIDFQGLHMDKIEYILNIINGLYQKEGGIIAAEDQLLKFADAYATLGADEAETLRNKFDEKDRLGLFQVACHLFQNSFPDAEAKHKNRLCKIFFALYSFDNLGFGYDSIRYVITASDLMKAHIDIAKANWDIFKSLTSNSLAINNLENHLFR